jgi:hypothetical protein
LVNRNIYIEIDIMERECKTHGLTDHMVRVDGVIRCKKCVVGAVQRRREGIKKMAVEYKGNSCEICGYDKCISALEFHHLDPTQKDFGISQNGITRSWEKVKIELDKCIMVCSNCHREIHEELKQK